MLNRRGERVQRYFCVFGSERRGSVLLRVWFREERGSNVTMSQPDTRQHAPVSPDADASSVGVSFSQPTHLEHLVLPSQLMGTPRASQVLVLQRHCKELSGSL